MKLCQLPVRCNRWLTSSTSRLNDLETCCRCTPHVVPMVHGAAPSPVSGVAAGTGDSPDARPGAAVICTGSNGGSALKKSLCRSAQGQGVGPATAAARTRWEVGGRGQGRVPRLLLAAAHHADSPCGRGWTAQRPGPRPVAHWHGPQPRAPLPVGRPPASRPPSVSVLGPQF